MRRWVGWGIVVAVVVVVVLQALPYGGPRTNPGISGEPRLDAHARELIDRACADCHSNRTDWPWYSAIAPVRWLVTRDVSTARAAMNFSEFDRPQRVAHDAAVVVRANEMPPARYAALHPAARLTAAERETLARGLDVLREGNDRTREAPDAASGGFFYVE